jgi:sec-independent protein translocase protein TatA
MSQYLPQLLLIEMPGGGELLIILVVVLLLFGGKKIPELMRGLGKGIREFNDAKGKITSELEEGIKEKDNLHSTPAQNYSTSTEQPIYPSATDETYTPHRETPIPPHSSNGKL